MERRPFSYEPERAVRQRPTQNLKRLDRDRRIPTGIQRVEVRDAMFGVVHRDHDPIELADPRHPEIVHGEPDERETTEMRPSIDPQDGGSYHGVVCATPSSPHLYFIERAAVSRM
jgi:hypothetical protein